MKFWYLYYCYFLGFGFKVPIWPFHYWMTKTHVEAPAGFSIFLSGFLVKSAVYGFYKIYNLLGGNIYTFLQYLYFRCFRCIFKNVRSNWFEKISSFWYYSRNEYYLFSFIWGDTFIIWWCYFLYYACFFVSNFFYLVDCIQRRYKTRNIIEIKGVLHITPNLVIDIVWVCLVYAGLPGTMKFIRELYIFSGFFEAAHFQHYFAIFIVNYIGIIGFSKLWYNCCIRFNCGWWRKYTYGFNF